MQNSPGGSKCPKATFAQNKMFTPRTCFWGFMTPSPHTKKPTQKIGKTNFSAESAALEGWGGGCGSF
jgi:hypothetical protein